MKKKYQLLKIKYAKQLIGNFLSLNLRQVTIDKEHFGCHGVFCICSSGSLSISVQNQPFLFLYLSNKGIKSRNITRIFFLRMYYLLVTYTATFKKTYQDNIHQCKFLV